MADENVKKVNEWVIIARRKNWNDERIKKEMAKKGYSKNLIDEVIAEFPRNPSWTRHLLPIILILIFVGVLIEGYLLFTSFYVHPCENDDCFITYANQCSPVHMTRTIAGSLYDLSEQKCILTKTVALMNDSEPDDVIDAFQDSQMNCSYRRGSFDPNLITTVSLGTDNCIGDLKDTLDSITSVFS